MPADAQIQCTKCGTPSAEPRLDCAKCGGRNARVCGKCGNQNSIAKNFCDQCGQSIVELGPIAPPPKERLRGEPSAGIPLTEIKNLPPSDAPSGPPALPGKPSTGSVAPLDDLWSAPVPPPVSAKTVSREKTSAWRPALNVFAALIGMTAAAYCVWTYRETHIPEIRVPKLAAQYLEELRTGDDARAYELFSDAAKRSVTLDEFRSARDTATWTWSNLRIEYREPDAILLGYDLKIDGAPPRRDHVLFTRAGERWVRPYNGTLMRRAEDSFNKGDADNGLILAQEAATVNPRDPVAWAYLCEAAYYRKLPADTEIRCARALEMTRAYPSNLPLKSLYRLHAILADTYHHALRSPDRALEQYAEMLAFPDISPADQCQILLARSQAYTSISRPGEALADLERASQLCVAAKDQAIINQMRENLRAPEAP